MTDRRVVVGGPSGWHDVVRRGSAIRRRRRRLLALALATVVVGSLTMSFAASGGFREIIGHSSDSPLTTLAGEIRGSDGQRVGSLELELPGTVSLIRSRLRPGPLRPFRVIRTHEGPSSTRASFKARWFLDLDGDWVVTSLSLSARNGGGRAPSVRLCAPCLSDHSGRLTLTLAQTTALVNERLRVDVLARSPLPAAGGALERVQTPVFWPRKQGLIGGRLESFERQSERKSPPERVKPA